jgi:hypothetical protein
VAGERDFGVRLGVGVLSVVSDRLFGLTCARARAYRIRRPAVDVTIVAAGCPVRRSVIFRVENLAGFMIERVRERERIKDRSTNPTCSGSRPNGLTY